MYEYLIIAYASLFIATWCLLIKIFKRTKPNYYSYKWETHDLETWRKRGIDSTKDKETKSILKNAELTQVVGLLYIIYGWDLTPCKK